MNDDQARSRPRARRTKPFERLPINKIAQGTAETTRTLPQINNPLIIGALSVGSKIVRPLIQNLKPSKRPGRPERFQQLVERTIQSAPVIAEAERAGGFTLRVDVNESFGKPTLVSVDLCLAQEPGDGPVVLLTDLLGRVVEALWDNPEVAPVAIRGRMVALQGQQVDSTLMHTRGRLDPNSDEIILLDMTALGYQDEIARPQDLYSTFGSPASDPKWHP